MLSLVCSQIIIKNKSNVSWHYRFDAVWSTLPLSWGMSCKRKHYTKRTRVIYISTSCKRELAATHEFSSRQMPDFFLAFTTTMQPPLWPIVYITKIAKLGNLLKLDIRKLSVLLHNRWRREVPSTGLTHKIRIFLEITLCMGAFVMYPFLTLYTKDWIFTNTRAWEHCMRTFLCPSSLCHNICRT